MEKDKIIETHPSICYTCDKARRVASEENESKGFVGCCLRVLEKHKTISGQNDHWAINEGYEVAEGWVDLKSPPFGKKSGIITNLQLLTYRIESCKEYIEIT